MLEKSLITRRGGRPSIIVASGYFLIAAGIVGLVLGWLLIGSLTDDFRVSLRVSRSAIVTVGETVDVVEDVAIATAGSIGSASASASSAAEVTRAARDGLAGVAAFLEIDLPTDVKAIAEALPGAIGAADAVDATLGALSLFGVDYSPEEPFGDSLRRVRDTLEGLPGDIRQQSLAIQTVLPLADALASDVDALARSLDSLESRLTDVEALAASYDQTVSEAEAVLEATDSSLSRTVLLLRALVVMAAAGSMAMGAALISISRRLESSFHPNEALVAEHARSS